MSYFNLISVLQQKISTLTADIENVKRSLNVGVPSAATASPTDSHVKEIQTICSTLADKVNQLESKINIVTSQDRSVSKESSSSSASLMKERILIETNITAKMENYMSKYVADKLAQYSQQINAHVDEKVASIAETDGSPNQYATKESVDDVLSRLTKLISNFVSRDQVKMMIESAIAENLQTSKISHSVSYSKVETPSSECDEALKAPTPSDAEFTIKQEISMEDINEMLNEVAPDIDMQMKRKVVRRGRPPNSSQTPAVTI